MVLGPHTSTKDRAYRENPEFRDKYKIVKCKSLRAVPTIPTQVKTQKPFF